MVNKNRITIKMQNIENRSPLVVTIEIMKTSQLKILINHMQQYYNFKDKYKGTINPMYY